MPTVISTNPNNEAECANCGSRMTFTRDEVRPGDPIPGDEDGDLYGVIICPNCRKPVRKSVRVTREQAQARHDREMREY